MSDIEIHPNDIRVGDKVRVTEVFYEEVISASQLRRLREDGDVAEVNRTYELLDRPQPKPEVGQHWLDTHGMEWVVLSRSSRLAFYSLTAGSSVNTALTPDGWTLKS